MIGDRGKLSSALPLNLFKIISTRHYASNSRILHSDTFLYCTWFLEIVKLDRKKFPLAPTGEQGKEEGRKEALLGIPLSVTDSNFYMLAQFIFSQAFQRR